MTATTSMIEQAVEKLRPIFGIGTPEERRELDAQAFLDLLADDITITFQGTDWPLGGSHVGKEAAVRFFAAVKRCCDLVEFHDANFATGERHVAVEWFSHVTNWKGETKPNAGTTVFVFDDDVRITDWREYTDTEMFAALLNGWRERLGPELGSGLPNWDHAEA